MKIKVIKRYNDKYTHITCEVGEIKEYPQDRASLLIKNGYAEEVKIPKKIVNEDEE